MQRSAHSHLGCNCQFQSSKLVSVSQNWQHGRVTQGRVILALDSLKYVKNLETSTEIFSFRYWGIIVVSVASVFRENVSCEFYNFRIYVNFADQLFFSRIKQVFSYFEMKRLKNLAAILPIWRFRLLLRRPIFVSDRMPNVAERVIVLCLCGRVTSVKRKRKSPDTGNVSCAIWPIIQSTSGNTDSVSFVL